MKTRSFLSSTNYTASGGEFDLTGASDNCTIVDTTYELSGVTIIAETSSRTLDGIDFNLGITTVTWRVYDVVSNVNSCSFTVTIEDNEDPVITCVGDVTQDTDVGVCDAVVGGIAPATSSDNCSIGSITYTLTGATTGSGANDASGETFNLA